VKKVCLSLFIFISFVLLLRSGAVAEEVSRPITAWPLLYHKVEPDQEETDALFSLYRYERKETLIRYSIGYFLFLTEGDPTKEYRKTSVLWPLSRYKREGERISSYVFPLYWHKRTPENSYRVLLPLYWAGSGKDYSFTHLWPLYSRVEQGTYREYGTLYPLIRFGRDPDKDLELEQFLLFYHTRERENSFTTIFPLYGRNVEGPEKTSWLIPFYYSQSGPDSLLTLAPLYYHRKHPGMDTLYFWPFYRLHEEGGYREQGVFWPLTRFGRDRERDLELDQFLLFYHKRTGADSFSAVFPIWFSSRQPGTEWDLLFPVYYHGETPDTSVTTLIPLYHGTRSPEGSFRYVFPTYISSVTGTSTLRTLLPFFLSYQSPTVQFSAVTPLYMTRRTNESALTTLLPVYFDYERKDLGVTVGLPVYLRYRSELLRFSTIFPLYYHAEDREQRSAFTYYFPFYGEYLQGENRSRHFFLFPLYARYADREQQMTGWDVLWPFFHYEVSPTTRSVRVPPFYWHGESPGADYTVALPLYWSFTSGENSYRHLIPFYGVHREGDWYKKTFVLGPLFMDTRDSRTGLSQQDALLWLYSRQVEGEDTLSWFFPLYFHRSDSNSLLTLALPVLPYYHQRTSDHERLSIVPIYSMLRDKSYREHASFWPLIRFGRDLEQDVELDQFLLFYYKREQDHSRTTVFPLYWSAAEGARKRQLLVPLYYHREDVDSSSTLAFPSYYHRREAGSDRLHLWPLFSRKEQGSYREYGTLYPLIRFGRDPKRDVELDQFLLFYHEREQDRSTTAFFPLYYHQSDANSLLTFAPFYYHRREADTSTLYLWPFYRWHEEGTYREQALLWPLIRFGRDPVRDVELDQFLLFYHEREGAASFSTLFPLWWHQEKDEHRRRDLTLLLHWYERDDSRDETDLSLLWLIPPKISLFEYYRKGAMAQNRLFPLYSYSFDRERDAMSWSVLWFLFSYSSEGEFVQETGFLWKVISYERKDAETSDFRFLWRFIRKSSTATSSTFEFNPFYYYESDKGTGTYWAVLGGLFGVETTPENKKKFRLFWIF
jgi:hypothetical protein